jgi:hypothetical protein
MRDLTHEYCGCVLFIKIALGAICCIKLLFQHVEPQRGICKLKSCHLTLSILESKTAFVNLSVPHLQ